MEVIINRVDEEIVFSDYVEDDYFLPDEISEYIEHRYYEFYALMENIERFINHCKIFGISDGDYVIVIVIVIVIVMVMNKNLVKGLCPII